MSYLGLIKAYPRQLLYGLLHTTCSGNGQTFMVSLFVAYICAHFSISRTYFSTLYAGATIASAIVLPFSGALIDRWNLRLYSGVVAGCLGVASITKGSTDSIVLFCIALFFTRHCGQALMTHTSATSIARYFGKTRGKALAVANVGFPLAEAGLPIFVTFAFTFTSWQNVYIFLGASILVLFIPVTNLLLPRGSDFTDPRPMRVEEGSRQYTRAEVLRTRYIYLILPVSLLAPFLLTGFIFHQDLMADAKGWTIRWVASCFAAFALMRVTGSFLIGPLVDRFSARLLMPFYMLPFCAGAAFLIGESDKSLVPLVWGSAGLTTGFGSNLKQAIWAEIYGTQHLGAIRSMLGPLAVLSTALAPPIFSWGLEHGLVFDDLVRLSVYSILVLTALACTTLFSKN